MIKEVGKVVKEKFGSWEKFSIAQGYKYNSIGLWLRNNVNRINEKLKPLGLELTIKKIGD